ncbi:MAG: DMT family transporter [Candidatus Sumerlaeaceae bacterium]
MPDVSNHLATLKKPWLLFALITTLTWGVWGALIELPGKAGFPTTLGYAVWALTMVPCAIVALMLIGWRLERDPRTILLGSTAGLLGAGGQLLLFETLKSGPAYLVFPVVSLYPVLTIILAATLLREKAAPRTWAGIVLAIVAIPLLAYQPPSASGTTQLLWVGYAALVFVMWGLQGYVQKFASARMEPESLFFYMAVGALVLIPVALLMTDFSRPINWAAGGFVAAIAIQMLNSIGALFFVYAIRHGKAIIVVPMTSLAPVITIVLSLALYRVVPNGVSTTGLIAALVALYLMSL